MKTIYVLALMGLGLLAAVQVFGQEIGTDAMPVTSSHPDHSAFMAYLGDNNVVEMRWGRTRNDEIDRYVVEHSTDSAFFNALHTVVAKDGIDRDSLYQDADAFPGTTVNYYRLVTFLKDGHSFSSAAVKVVVDPGRTPTLVPTVLHAGETLRMDKYYRDKLMIIDFFTQGGKMIASYEINSSSFNVNTSNWQRGIYFYRITSEGKPLVDAGQILVL
jgi:hypothetical protein